MRYFAAGSGLVNFIWRQKVKTRCVRVSVGVFLPLREESFLCAGNVFFLNEFN